MRTIAEELTAWRDYFSLTQLEAAELLRVSRTTYQAFERGRRVPPYRELQRIRSLIFASQVGAHRYSLGYTR